MESAFLFLIPLLAIAAPLEAWSPVEAGPAGAPIRVEYSQPDVKQMLSIAEAQHEIVKVLIAQGRFDKVLPEMSKIFGLKLPDKYEEAVAQSASLIADLLVENKQTALAHEVLNEAFQRMALNENKASILKIEAFVYKSEGNLERALECLQRSVELEMQR